MNVDPTSLLNLKFADYFIVVSLNGVLTFLISLWIKSRLENSIKHEYDKKLADYNSGLNTQLEDHKLGTNQKLEDYKLDINTRLEDHKFGVNKQLEEYKFDIRKREQAAKVVQLFSLLHSGVPGDENEEAKALASINSIAWELSLWLPAEIVRELTRCLEEVEGAKDPKQILIEIRKVLLGHSDDLQPEEIIHFLPGANDAAAGGDKLIRQGQ
jgi:hypothetical protein